MVFKITYIRPHMLSISKTLYLEHCIWNIVCFDMFLSGLNQKLPHLIKTNIIIVFYYYKYTHTFKFRSIYIF